ncbi:MAG: 2-oxoglutarate ferredoxin oxidoreductase subunit alpha [Gammaproteobacteria bacterium]|nr:MAG: 2-oxoglutarate ferredoxin oxidoreductase subunit alpha [Gammaproteobacteria bacterium]
MTDDIVEEVKSNGRKAVGDLTIKFAGDSGDGIQLTGQKFAELASNAGEMVKTMPDFPAEIRSPIGSLGGVSGFQIRTGSEGIHTHGDELDMLVAMNPASLKRNVENVKTNAIIIVNQDTFTDKNLKKAEYEVNPLEDNSLDAYRVFPVSVTKMTMNSLKGTGLSRKVMDRCKNFFALGLICWLFPHPSSEVESWIKTKFKKRPELVDANLKVFQAGWNYGETEELFATHYTVKQNKKLIKKEGTRFVTGNTAVALGLVSAARRAGIKLFLGGYPITPATEVMQELLQYQDDDVVVFQAEDEIAAAGSSLGASFAGALGATSTSGPGLALMQEFINLAVIAELPLVIVNVQRAGPSTGVPTKTEQSDLLQAMWGRNGESPIPVFAAATPADCYDVTVEAAYIAIKYMTPVIVMSDTYLSASAEAWAEPNINSLPDIKVNKVAEDVEFAPYRRNPETLARAWAVPGMEGTEHVTGGLEKDGDKGGVSYNPDDHEMMVNLRAQKIANISSEIALPGIQGAEDADLLIVGWGSTYGAITEATEDLNEAGHKVACIQLRHINPLPDGLGDLLKSYDKVLVAENNNGQLWIKLRSEFLLDLQKLSKVRGMPFNVNEITERVETLLSPAVTGEQV